MKKSNNTFPFFIVATIIALLGYSSYAYLTGQSKIDTAVPSAVENKTDPRVEKIMNEVDFKKMVELKAKKIIAEQDRKAENERNANVLKAEQELHQSNTLAIETRIEELRKEELDLASSTSSFLE